MKNFGLETRVGILEAQIREACKLLVTMEQEHKKNMEYIGTLQDAIMQLQKLQIDQLDDGK